MLCMLNGCAVKMLLYICELICCRDLFYCYKVFALEAADGENRSCEHLSLHRASSDLEIGHKTNNPSI